MINSILNIIKKRALPGLLIFDADYRLLYFNREAQEIFSQGGGETQLEGTLPEIPEEVLTLLSRLKSSPPGSAPGRGEGMEMADSVPGSRLSLRASYLGATGHGEIPQHMMVLIERIMEKREIDLEVAQKEFQFSRKEIEVLQHICRGLPNRNIAEKMFISENTVKNHIKKIMRRMRVKSRSEIVVTLR